MEKLKPCPFCGNEPTIRMFKGKDGWRDRYAVICRYDEGGCGAESGLYHYEKEAIEAWNRRAEPQWIPCSERLPEKGQECLTCDNGKIDFDKFLGYGNPYNWEWYLSDHEAWMPVPEPYAERREK